MQSSRAWHVTSFGSMRKAGKNKNNFTCLTLLLAQALAVCRQTSTCEQMLGTSPAVIHALKCASMPRAVTGTCALDLPMQEPIRCSWNLLRLILAWSWPKSCLSTPIHTLQASSRMEAETQETLEGTVGSWFLGMCWCNFEVFQRTSFMKLNSHSCLRPAEHHIQWQGSSCRESITAQNRVQCSWSLNYTDTEGITMESKCKGYTAAATMTTTSRT